VCLKYGVPGAGEALVRAADVGNPAVVKVILQHWTGEDDMVGQTFAMSFFLVALKHTRENSLLFSSYRYLFAVVVFVLFLFVQDDNFLARALAHAARAGDIASVRLLLEQGANATVVFGSVRRRICHISSCLSIVRI